MLLIFDSRSRVGEVLLWVFFWRWGYLKGVVKDGVGVYSVEKGGDDILGRVNSKGFVILYDIFA